MGFIRKRENTIVNLLGIDIETTGFSHQYGSIIEVGWQSCILENGSIDLGYEETYLINNPKVRYIPDEIVEITGITMAQLRGRGKPPHAVINRLAEVCKAHDYLVAFNCAFEKRFLKAAGLLVDEYQWIDALHDVEYPKEMGSKKLENVLAFHEIDRPVAHRALADVEGMMTVFERYNFEKILEKRDVRAKKRRKKTARADQRIFDGEGW